MYIDLFPELRGLIRAKLDLRERAVLMHVCKQSRDDEEGKFPLLPETWRCAYDDAVRIWYPQCISFFREAFRTAMAFGLHRWPPAREISTSYHILRWEWGAGFGECFLQYERSGLHSSGRTYPRWVIWQERLSWHTCETLEGLPLDKLRAAIDIELAKVVHGV